ncbi:keratin-associated protein 5-5-like [Sphaerodactylus townsendi]|uniref:keratin-associated protein 5-5-like n=1 Tax=Sphaerodactylus townsendi TaxID=933632 RepID=UPI0020269E89|nr:keratin-associated protein 5-5-like [Sphaerodactylus townsendi]
MSCCCPSCAVPSCPKPCCCQPCCSPCSYPTGGLGSLSCCSNSCCGNTGCGNSCCGNTGCGNSCCSNTCCGNSTSARSLGITCGAHIACINQIPPSEVVIQPPPCIITIPGPVLAATCEPVRVGGYTACGTCCPPCGRICGSSC